jgi:3-oxoacyl-[acyl-carrier-protein] synthase-3
MGAYITGLGTYLPNASVDNGRMEDVLGIVGDRPSRLKEMILASNGIHERYYAIDPVTGEQTHTNAELTAAAISALADRSGFSTDEIQLLACGSSSPDQLIPNHAAMVHGLIRCPPCEVVSTAGVCCSGMTALKYAALSVSSGSTTNAVVTGSEVASVGLRAAFFNTQANGSGRRTRSLSFDQEFLRWMLSDGAAAALVEDEPGRERRGGVALRIDWLDIVSLANELDTCMYQGATKTRDGALQGWLRQGHAADPWIEGCFNLSQDVRLLKQFIVPVALQRSFDRVRQRRDLCADRIDWLLPHLSSEYFRAPMCGALESMGFVVPQERWFTNLSRKGNTGSASIFIMLEELFASGRLRKGERILCAVPESARFTFAYMHLTVV